MFDWVSVTSDDLLALPLEEALEESERRECRAYSKVFRERAQPCEDGGDADSHTAWSLLVQLTDLRLHGNDRSEPFPPSVAGLGRRTMIPSDLRGEPAEAVRTLVAQVRDPELRARLSDVIWEATRDHTAAENAVRSYLQSARQLLDPDEWVAYFDRCARALRLAVVLRRGDLQAEVVSEVETTLSDLNGEDPLFLTIRLVSLLLDTRCGDVASLSAISERAASVAEGVLAFDRARAHLENLAFCCRRLGDEDGERAASGRIATCFEKQGRLLLDSGEHMAAVHWLEQAHVKYRETPGGRERAGEVYELLRVAQREAAGSMTLLDLPPIDITEEVGRAEGFVAGHDFLDALWRLFNILPTTNFVEAEQTAKKNLEESVFLRLAARSTVAPDGRVVARGNPPALDNADGSPSELWEQVVEVVSMYHEHAGLAVIQPAMWQIMLEHAPSYQDVHDFVSTSPFVPFGREGLFAKGLLAGLRGDMVEALSVLLPQFENGIRHLLRSVGVETSSMDKMGNQDVFQLGRILSLPELERVIGSNMVKDMKVSFTDSRGPKRRDYMSHGLMSAADFYSGSAYYAWWLACRVCFHPSLRKQVGALSSEMKG